MFKQDLNVVTLTGTIGTLKSKENHTFVSVAIGNGVDEDGDARTVWVPCNAFSNTKTYIDKYASVGSGIVIKGRLSSYADQDDRNRVTIVIDSANVLSKKDNGNSKDKRKRK